MQQSGPGACYRFTRKLRKHYDLLQWCIASVLDGVQMTMPEFGQTVAIDEPDIPTYANGQPYLSTGV